MPTFMLVIPAIQIYLVLHMRVLFILVQDTPTTTLDRACVYTVLLVPTLFI